MFDGQTLGAEIVTTVRDFVARSLSPIVVRLDAVEKREPLPGKDGVDGKDAEVDVDKIVAEVLAQIPTPQDGVDGKDGKDADTTAIAASVAEAMSTIPDVASTWVDLAIAKLPKPKDGVDGKDVDPSLVKELLSSVEKLTATAKTLADDIAVLRALPVSPASFLIDAAGDLLAVYPDGETKTIGTVRGKDGARGSSIMDGTVDDKGQLVMRMSDGRHIKIGTIRGEKGNDGKNGRDAADIHILPAIDETKSYAEGVFAMYRGGLIRATRQTVPFDDDPIKAGWGAVLDGIAEETERSIDGGRFVERTTVYTSGKKWTRKVQTEAQIWRDIWKEDGDYLRGDMTTRDGSTWHCQVSGTQSVPGTSSDWKLCAKRGNHGKDGKNGIGQRGQEGKPGRDLTQLGFDGGKH